MDAGEQFVKVNPDGRGGGGDAGGHRHPHGGRLASPPQPFRNLQAPAGQRRGLNWNAGGGWRDGTPATFPDWLQVTFPAVETITEVNVFTLQDNSSSPAAPTTTMTFTRYGIVDFDVQYWSGAQWIQRSLRRASGSSSAAVWPTTVGSRRWRRSDLAVYLKMPRSLRASSAVHPSNVRAIRCRRLPRCNGHSFSDTSSPRLRYSV